MELWPAVVAAVAWITTPTMKTEVATMMLYFLEMVSAKKPAIVSY
jgi:hypothetical protein